MSDYSYHGYLHDIRNVQYLNMMCIIRLPCYMYRLSCVFTYMMAHSVLLWLKTQRYGVQIPTGLDFCHRGYAYTVLQTVQQSGVCSAVYDTVHDKEPLKSFDNGGA